MNIHCLFILKDSGACVYSRNFTEELEGLDVNLISPFFSAIFSFSESIVSRDLEVLEMSGLRFIFKVVDDFIFTVLSDSTVSPLFVSTRLDRLVDAFFKFYNQLDELQLYQEIDDPEFENLVISIISGREEIFKNPQFYQKVIVLFKDLIFENEILGASLISSKGNIIYSSLPNEILLSSLKELEIRFISGVMNLPESYHSLDNNQKIFSKIIIHDRSGLNFFLVLYFESSVPLGMASVNLQKISKQIDKLLSIYT